MVRISGSLKFRDPVEDSNTGRPSSIIVRMEYLLTFQYWYCELCVENQWREGRKHCFVNFFLWWCFNLWWMGVVGWDRKSYLGPAEMTSFSSRDFCRSNKHDKCCIDWIFLRFIFMNHCRFRFTFLEVYKNLGFPSSNYHFYSQQPHR